MEEVDRIRAEGTKRWRDLELQLSRHMKNFTDQQNEVSLVKRTLDVWGTKDHPGPLPKGVDAGRVKHHAPLSSVSSSSFPDQRIQDGAPRRGTPLASGSSGAGVFRVKL